ncbi:uncharacterized protein LOC132718738 isoform X1 [Ruditapes philippinarum]|uniref:uncharacterized protein LOC132718738 isoform X1 n=1 Tax=Ruditapes philippinarum TaxID=129788 RepID=UPI00295AAE0D|nr:uncharacterized protein LOC132718738 isoform X1 [Ruditapes philippinarum]XP_060558440.1 uncharacterized protein LOC132718738 isoform X1 [Ruditapes philippinarum]XP_060558441.1 uncharacterized protein LOC132718738 isoform X1 [Ruditapes philippinarum]
MEGPRESKSSTDERQNTFLKPNYFVTIQITDKETLKNLQAEQKDFLSRYPRYKDSVIPQERFHVTLTVLELPDEDHIKECIATLENVKDDIIDLARKAGKLTFRGLGSFSTRVIFAKLEFSNEFMQLVDLIRNSIAVTGIKVELKPLKAHVTLFKVKSDTYKEMGIYMYKGKLILASLFDPDPYFGSQDINNVQICEISGDREDNGFYRNIFNLSIDHSK